MMFKRRVPKIEARNESIIVAARRGEQRGWGAIRFDGGIADNIGENRQFK